MDIKKEMASLLLLIGYVSFNWGLCVGMRQEIDRLNKETEILVNQIVDDLEEIYLTQQNQEQYENND